MKVIPKILKLISTCMLLLISNAKLCFKRMKGLTHALTSDFNWCVLVNR